MRKLETAWIRPYVIEGIRLIVTIKLITLQGHILDKVVFFPCDLGSCHNRARPYVKDRTYPHTQQCYKKITTLRREGERERRRGLTPCILRLMSILTLHL
jgi:hypothetical protein